MAETLGYMITWTTYGTWLQGDKRGYVKDGIIFAPNDALMEANRQNQSKDAVTMSKEQRQLVEKAILDEAELQKQTIYSISVQANHIHIVAEYIPKPIGRIVACYKKAGRLALHSTGITGKVWTQGYDKRFCFDHDSLQKRIDYVKNHPP